MVDKLNYIISFLVCYYRNTFYEKLIIKEFRMILVFSQFFTKSTIRSIPSDNPISFSASKYYKRTTMDSSSFQKWFDKKETF